MKKLIVAAGLLYFIWGINAQSIDTTNTVLKNTSEEMMGNSSKLIIGGYGQIDYNQPIKGDVRNNGKLDVHRMVLLFGYKFNNKTQFITEIEFEHVKEVYIEQAFINHQLVKHINFRGGLMLIPIGLINEYHEPTNYRGVERPLVDKYIIPTTWREIGAGFTGNFPIQGIKYQAYVVNGFNGYDGSSHLGGKNGLRKGRQKGAESYISSPNITANIGYYGIRGLQLGLGTYLGKSQSNLYNGLDLKDKAMVAQADSSFVGITMLSANAIYTIKNLEFRGQLYYTQISNTEKYNTFTAVDGTNNDLGKSMSGYYTEVAYSFNVNTYKLIPFARYEAYNLHAGVDNITTVNKAYNVNQITTGIDLQLSQGAVLKADIQLLGNKASTDRSTIFNAGIGIKF